MQAYKVKAIKIAGTSFREVYPKAHHAYNQVKKKTKRRPYVRSAYFKREKVFLDLFWHHLFEKLNWRDRVRRLQYYACALELIQYSRLEPKTKENPNKTTELYHRFVGLAGNQEFFYVQIKEDKGSGKKYLLSIFPYSE